MDIRRAYHRRGIKRARLHKRLAVAAMLAAAACAAFVLQAESQGPAPVSYAAAMPAAQMTATPALLRVAADATPAPPRRVYPYSIVPGGVTSRAEVAHAVMADKVVAAHYAGFAVEKASLRTVAGARAVYVSYRKGDQVYWTARKVTLADGETIVSDGQNELRARCGNRISDTPRLPVEVKGPDERELDTPVEQAGDAGDGALRQTAFALGDEDGAGQRFALASFPDGAGLLTAGQARAGADQASFGSLLDGGARRPLLEGLASPVSRLASRTTNSSPANNGTTNSGTAETPAASDTGASNTGGSGTDGGAGGVGTGGTGGKPAADGPGTGTGTGTGTDGGTSAGTDPGTGKPAVPGTHTDPLPNGTLPPKTHDVPEPDSLWLMGVAAAALLLQRRLRSRRPR
jgi:hypothetical protein